MASMENRECTLCGPGAPKREKYAANFSPEDLNVAIFSARRQPDRRHFRLVECDECGIIYSDPACTPDELAKLYEGSAVHYDDQEGQIYDSYAPVLDRALERTALRGTFVEVGGGRGFMLRYGAEHGFREMVEVEPSADAERRFEAPAANARFLRGILEPGTLAPGSASLVCFFQMLDHLPDPMHFVRTVYDALEPGGVAVCVTHDTSAATARLLGELSPIFDIEHTYLFNRENLARLFEKAGFEGASTFPIANDYSLRYWLAMAPLPRAAKQIIAPVGRTRLGRVRLRAFMGNMGLIATRPAR